MVSMRFASLRDRLVALIVLAALPTLGLALYTHAAERRQAAQEGREAALRFAGGLVRAHEQRLGEARRLLVTLAAQPETRAGDSTACGVRYAALLREFPDMTTLGVAGAGGEVTCSAVPLSRPLNVTDRPWFDRAVRTQAFATGDHELDPATGKPQLVAALPVPYPGGGTQFVVFAALDLGWVGRFAAADLPADWAVALSDDRGTILARHPDPWRWVGQRLPEAAVVSAAVAEKGEGTAEVAGADGVVRLLGFAPVPGPAGTRRAYLSVSLPQRGGVRRRRPGARAEPPRAGARRGWWRSPRPGSAASGSSSAGSSSWPTRPAGWPRATSRRARRWRAGTRSARSRAG